MPRSRIRIFRKECTRSTQLALNSCLGAFWIVSLLHKARYKAGWTCVINAKVRATKSHRNFSQSTHPIHPHWTLNSCFDAFGGVWVHFGLFQYCTIGAFRSVWVHFGLFRYCTKLGAKWAELVQLVQKFRPRSRIRIFCNECTRSTPLGPKHMFWCIS